LDKFSVSIPFSELKPLLENDLQDRDARLKLIEVLSPGVLNEFTQEANRIPVPGDGYDELALLFNSSGLSERLLWAINLSIFTAGTGMLYKHGVLHAKGELDEAREARAHLLGVTHRISHLDERINEETAKLESEISKLEKKHGDLLSRINRDDRRATSGEKASLSKNEDQIRDLTERKIVLTEASERISEEKDKVKKAMTHINWVVADAAFELSGLLLMTGGTMAGMSQSIALAVKTFHEGTIASNAVTAMEFSTVGAHAFLALGSLCTMFTGARAFYNGISPTKTEFKRQVAELESNKATLMSKRDPLKAEIRALEQKHVTGEFTPEETKLLDTKKLELQLLGELETVFDDVKHYVEAEGDFESRSLMLRGANLFVGSGLLAFFNTSHVLVDAGLIMSAQSPLEGPAGLVVLGVGVTMVMVGLMVGLFREGQASKHRVVDFASSHLRHEFETKVQLVRDLIKVSTSDTEVVDTLLDTFARSFAKKEFDAANHAWQVRKQIELQLRPGRKRGVPTDQKIKRLVKEDAHAGHFEWRRFFKAKINYGPLSIREVFKENEGAVLNVHDGSVAGRVERHASARIVSDFLTSVHAHFDSTRGTRARAGFNFGSGTEKSELAQAWIDYLHRQGQLEIVLEGMARDASLSQLISSVRHRRATKMNDYREKVTIHSKDKKKLYQQPKRVFAFVGNAFATAGSWMKYGAKRCLSENPMRPDGWSKYFNDSGYSKRARVTRVNVAAVMQDIRANKGDVIDSFFDESVRVFFSNKGPGRRVDLVYRGRVVSAAKAQVDPSVLLAA
jgi:predicted nuclease with TOPRIM domain